MNDREREIKIGRISIGLNFSPMIIAEMSGNHNSSLDAAFAIVDAAADSGCHALKLQTYTADTMTIPGVARIEDKDSLWKGKELYELYSEAHTPWDWHEAIFSRARKRGLEVFSSPFDDTAVDFLESLKVPAYKIASFENSDHALLRKVAATGKPVIMSTGASTIAEICESVQVLREAGCRDLILLRCTSSYPALPKDSNIATIPHLAEMFDCHVGLSDHTLGIGVAIASVALGARVIEKHLTLSRDDGGVDSAFSLEPAEMSSLVQESDRAFQAIGKVSYGVQSSEQKSLIFKRSVYVVKDVKEGEVLSSSNLRVIRPGYGLAPKYYDQVIGRKAKKDIQAGTALSWELLL